MRFSKFFSKAKQAESETGTFDGIKDDGNDYPITVRHSLRAKRKLCPKCLSPMRPASSFGGWLIPETYTCEACGYHGPVAFEESSEGKSTVEETEAATDESAPKEE